MGIVLTELKILGIILVCVLGLILFLLLIVLFYPVGYLFNGAFDADTEEKAHLSAKISWFFHIISVLFTMDGVKEKSLKIRIFGITVMDLFHPREKKTKKAKKKRKSKQESGGDDKSEGQGSAEEASEPFTSVKEDFEDTVETQQSEGNGEKPLLSYEEQIRQKDPEHKRKVFFDRIESAWEKLGNFIEKIKALPEELGRFQDQWEDKALTLDCWLAILSKESTQKALAMGRDDLVRLLRGILPGEWNAQLFFGMEDPKSTGQIYGYYWMFAPLYIGHFFAEPDFENKVMRGTIHAKGRIFLFRIVGIGLKVLLKKEYKYLLHINKRVEALKRHRQGLPPQDDKNNKKKNRKKKKAA